MAGYLDHDDVKERASALLLKHARKEWPKIIGAVGLVSSTDTMADKLAEKLARALINELHDVLSQPEHPVRQDYERWVIDYIDRLGADPDVAAQVEALKQRIIAHPQVQEYVQNLWKEIQAALRRDLSTPDSAMARHLERALQAMGKKLANDAALRDALNNHLLSGAQRLTETLRNGVDFWWDEYTTNDGNCWFDNTGAGGGPARPVRPGAGRRARGHRDPRSRRGHSAPTPRGGDHRAPGLRRKPGGPLPGARRCAPGPGERSGRCG